MTFCLIRFEVANIFRRILYVPPGPVRCNTFLASLSTEQKEKWINECHQRMEETYLRDVDLSIPLFWVTATLSRLMLSKLWLVVYHPYQRLDMGASLPQEKKDKLFLTSLESIEYGCLLENDRRTKKWGWLFRTCKSYLDHTDRQIVPLPFLFIMHLARSLISSLRCTMALYRLLIV